GERARPLSAARGHLLATTVDHSPRVAELPPAPRSPLQSPAGCGGGSRAAVGVLAFRLRRGGGYACAARRRACRPRPPPPLRDGRVRRKTRGGWPRRLRPALAGDGHRIPFS